MATSVEHLSDAAVVMAMVQAGLSAAGRHQQLPSQHVLLMIAGLTK
jgi:hypothetical protein